MSMTVNTPSGPWARTHWAALVISVLAVMLAASLAVLAVHLVTDAGSGSASGSSVTVVHPVEPVDNGCQVARPGMPC